MPNEEVWTIEELVALSDTVQHGKVEYRGKTVNFQFCELTEAEEPKVNMVDENATPDEKNEFYTKVGTERILSMIAKANTKNPDGILLDADNWSSLPTSLRFNISTEILSLNEDVAANFITG
tara:strand:+ start:191 stop:556 length:366 start_codon:yes stop_codon:yes gene_type:complete